MSTDALPANASSFQQCEGDFQKKKEKNLRKNYEQRAVNLTTINEISDNSGQNAEFLKIFVIAIVNCDGNVTDVGSSETTNV